MYYILISFVFLVISSSLLSQDIKEYKFNWYPIIRILDEDTVLLPDSSKFENFEFSLAYKYLLDHPKTSKVFSPLEIKILGNENRDLNITDILN